MRRRTGPRSSLATPLSSFGDALHVGERRVSVRIARASPLRAAEVRRPALALGREYLGALESIPDKIQRILEQDKIVSEYREVMEKIADLLDILSNPARVTEIIAQELNDVREQFAVGTKDKRRSEIVTHTQDLGVEDLIAPQDMVVTLSHTGYIKSQPLTDYRAQRRGGRGKQAAAIKDDDFVEHLFVANTHDYILCFSNRGRCYWLKVYEVPQGSRISRGKPIVNMFPLDEGEKINAILPVKEFAEDRYVFMATAGGTVKKTALDEFSNPRKAGIIAVDV